MDKFSIKRLKEFVALAKSNSFAGAKTKSNKSHTDKIVEDCKKLITIF